MKKAQQFRGSKAEPDTLMKLHDAGARPDDRKRILFLESEGRRLRAELREAHHLVNELSELADRDPLIEVMNRRAFVREMSRVMASVERYKFKANLVYVDLNNLKTVNDTFGHAAGDAALRCIGEFLTTHVRQTDAVGRLGGDEFGILLAHTSPEMAELKMEQLASVIAAKPMTWEGNAIPLSISYGVFPILQGQSVDEALHMADQAMYANKRAGQSG